MELTIQEDGATLSATFHCTLGNNVPSTEARMTISTVSLSTPDIAVRNLTTHFWSKYHEPSGIVSVFTKRGEPRIGGRFVTPSIPPSGTPPCVRFEQGSSLVRLLATTAAEVAYFNRNVMSSRPLIVTGKYIRAATRRARQSGTIVKLVIADQRLNLGPKPGEFIIRKTRIRYTRLDKIDRSDIAAGTLIVFVSVEQPFPLEPTKTVNILSGPHTIPVSLETNLISAYKKLDNCPVHIKEFVGFIDLCINPILDGLPDPKEYLDHLRGGNSGQTIAMIMEQVIFGADIYDRCVFNKVIEVLGARINAYLDDSLLDIARSLGFARVISNDIRST